MQKKGLIDQRGLIEEVETKTLGVCKIIRRPGRVLITEADGVTFHSEITEDWTKVSPAYYFSSVPIGAIVNQSKKVLLIGLAMGTIHRFYKNFFKDIDMTSIEYCPTMAELAKKWGSVPEEEIIVGDGSEVVHDLLGIHEYDQIIVDAFDLSGVPPSFKTNEFWTAIGALLSDKGILTVNYYSVSGKFKKDFTSMQSEIDKLGWDSMFAHKFGGNQYIAHYCKAPVDFSLIENKNTGYYNPYKVHESKLDETF